MKFPKDILVVDFEGLIEPIQIGAVLLDKETLEEKASFSSYVNAKLDDWTHKASGITQEILDGAPSQAEVGKMVYDKFGTNLFIAGFVVEGDIRNFKKLITAAGADWSLYDYHVLDIWPVAYMHMLKKGYTGGFRSEEIFQFFGAKPRGLHDALEDSRIAAEVLRKL